MNMRHKIFAVLNILAYLAGTPVCAGFVDDVKAYAAAADAANWADAATLAERLLSYPADILPMSRDERVQMVQIAADAAAQAGQAERAIELYRRLIAEIEARDGQKSYALSAPLGRLADLLIAQKQFDDAALLFDRSVTLSEDELGVDNTALLPLYEARRNNERMRIAAAAPDLPKQAMLQQRLDDQDYQIETLQTVAKARTAAPQTATQVTRGDNDAPFRLVPIHYGTNREATGKPELAQFYSDKRGPLALGVATVSVPKARAIGEIPLPSMWRGDFRPDAAKHFILTRMDPIASSDAFAASARAQIEKSKLREALVFIHGYNSDFQSAVFRAAQLAVDLDIDGAAFMYSWPSKGSLPGYVADGAQLIRPLTRSLQEFLNIVVRKTGAERVHVVAHSMGNRYLLEALDLIARDVPADQHKPIFQQVVFAAPDVDAEDFTDRVRQIGWLAQRMTLYASSKDRALYLSSFINGGYRRAGDAAALVTIPGLDTVDTTEVGGEGLGHGDFADRALDDFRAIVWLSLPPKARCGLVYRRQPSGSDYWQLTLDQIKTCPAEAFRTAISLLRALGPADALKYVREKIESARIAKDATAEARYVALLPIFDSVK